ncbi:protein FAM107B-like [Seriola lalandi dorsalis]|uniref:protein FAM107B-like n=1 Tax=Seriola lalandi dorsalis TaxID=1841481 RepID=UPI000C6F456C|nr:protein FAM107B-like [Seriola lalandi dorsalis]XP_056241877.1 protein FAM107B isoform X4 [Seriola aureovittata]
MSISGSLPNNNTHTHKDIQLNNTHPQSNNHRKDNGVHTEASSGHSNPIKTLRTHNELHKELLLAHKRGLALSSRSELQQVLERRKRVQNDQKEVGQSRTPLEDVLLRRQQKQLEREKEQEEKLQEEAQLMEFVRVRQNLRKIHSVIQNKTAHF